MRRAIKATSKFRGPWFVLDHGKPVKFAVPAAHDYFLLLADPSVSGSDRLVSCLDSLPIQPIVALPIKPIVAFDQDLRIIGAVGVFRPSYWYQRYYAVSNRQFSLVDFVDLEIFENLHSSQMQF